MYNNLYTTETLKELAGNTYEYTRHPQEAIHITNTGHIEFDSATYDRLYPCLEVVNRMCNLTYDEDYAERTMKATFFVNPETGNNIAEDAQAVVDGTYEKPVDEFEGLGIVEHVALMDYKILNELMDRGGLPNWFSKGAPRIKKMLEGILGM